MVSIQHSVITVQIGLNTWLRCQIAAREMRLSNTAFPSLSSVITTTRRADFLPSTRRVLSRAHQMHHPSCLASPDTPEKQSPGRSEDTCISFDVHVLTSLPGEAKQASAKHNQTTPTLPFNTSSAPHSQRSESDRSTWKSHVPHSSDRCVWPNIFWGLLAGTTSSVQRVMIWQKRVGTQPIFS
jgi:hypothetical protein